MWIKNSMIKSFSLEFNERPKAKARPRATKTGHVYTPKTTSEAEARLAAAWQEAGGPLLEGPLEVHLAYSPDSVIITVHPSPHSSKTLTGDLDNYIKLTLDALNGVAWADDRQVVRLMAMKVDRLDNS
jgi:crossover junction endodeoxyribonuclease RusA